MRHLGTVTLISLEEPTLIADWIELSLYLNKQKKFKWLGKGMNILLASAIISDEWIKETTASEVAKISLSISIESLIAAQTAALIAATSASIAASNAAAIHINNLITLIIVNIFVNKMQQIINISLETMNFM
jgi:hypothetical protein